MSVLLKLPSVLRVHTLFLFINCFAVQLKQYTVTGLVSVQRHLSLGMENPAHAHCIHTFREPLLTR